MHPWPADRAAAQGRGSTDMRTEHDLLGAHAVPADAYWGVHTARAVANFPLLGQPPAPALVRAMATVKLACARTNRELGFLDETRGRRHRRRLPRGRRRRACRRDRRRCAAGRRRHVAQHERQRGDRQPRRGTARRAGAASTALVHPIDHVNLHQSTNDVFPTALKVAAIGAAAPAGDGDRRAAGGVPGQASANSPTW